MHHIFSFGGGATSFVGALRLLEQYGPKNVTIVNAALENDEPFISDVLIAFEQHTGKKITRISVQSERYRLMRRLRLDAYAGNLSPLMARALRKTIIRLTPASFNVSEVSGPLYSVFDAFWARGILGNSRIDPCSDALKRQPLRRWITENYAPGAATLALGMTSAEEHRWLAPTKIYRDLGYPVSFPLEGAHYAQNGEALREFERIAGFLPHAYRNGLKHNNCGPCVKGGHKHHARVLWHYPELYQQWLQNEELHQAVFEHGSTMLKKERSINGMRTSGPYSLRQLQADCEAKWAKRMLDPFDSFEDTSACRMCASVA